MASNRLESEVGNDMTPLRDVVKTVRRYFSGGDWCFSKNRWGQQGSLINHRVASYTSIGDSSPIVHHPEVNTRQYRPKQQTFPLAAKEIEYSSGRARAFIHWEDGWVESV